MPRGNFVLQTTAANDWCKAFVISLPANDTTRLELTVQGGYALARVTEPGIAYPSSHAFGPVPCLRPDSGGKKAVGSNVPVNPVNGSGALSLGADPFPGNCYTEDAAVLVFLSTYWTGETFINGTEVPDANFQRGLPRNITFVLEPSRVANVAPQPCLPVVRATATTTSSATASTRSATTSSTSSSRSGACGGRKAKEWMVAAGAALAAAAGL
ncbi:hypothetical protein DFJ74DRAFT_704854 [Hyaloraphidium curvatum]|nr:hypothetical protein DFJ74DRAFT_704854 [Hyaloraphidium curvatum]